VLRRSNVLRRCIPAIIGLLMVFFVARPHALRADATLVYLRAAAQVDGTILVEWQTSYELNTSSFRVYQALTASGPWTEDKIVDEETAQGDAITTATYEFSDDSVEAGKTYYYLLEEIENGGASRHLKVSDRVTTWAPGQATFTPTSTSTATGTATSSPSQTPAPTNTSPPTDAPTATRQFTNTPRPGNTPTHTATLAPGQSTATSVAGSATMTPIVSPQLTTPTHVPGATAPIAPPVATKSAVAAPPAAPTATRTPTRVLSATPTATVARTPSATPSPAVFVSKATAEPVLRGKPGRPTAPTTTQGAAERDEGLALVGAGGAVLLAALLVGAALVIWRRRRS
jgi:hypothetical protein